MFVDRSMYQVWAEKGASDVKEEEVKVSNNTNVAHWKNFLDCIRTREKPNSDIEKCYRSSASCLLANVALRSRLRLDWDGETVKQAEAKKLLTREYRKPWKLSV
jgi:hypothetical protein